MPRGHAYKTELEAVEIVRAEYERSGLGVGPALSKREERRQGCDFFVERGAERVAVEVKGWGEPLRCPDGSWTYPADINAQQYKRATDDDNWRLEIVANLTAARNGSGLPERLTLSAAQVRARAVPLKLAVPLEGCEDQIREVHPPP